MPAHVLHTVPSLVTEIVNMISDASSGSKLTTPKNRQARLGAREPYTSKYTAKAEKNANAPNANNEIGMPPQ